MKEELLEERVKLDQEMKDALMQKCYEFQDLCGAAAKRGLEIEVQMDRTTFKYPLIRIILRRRI